MGKLIFSPDCLSKFFNRQGQSHTVADLFWEFADVKADIEATPFADEEWDIIISNHVLEHVNDFNKAIKELYRITSKGGFVAWR